MTYARMRHSDIQMTASDALAFFALIFAAMSMWVAAWLHWVFHGEVRHFLIRFVFPDAWKGGREDGDIATMLPEDMETFLTLESDAPPFVRGLLTCPGCLSAHFSGYAALMSGAALALLGAPVAAAIALPILSWAPSAWAGHRLHRHI